MFELIKKSDDEIIVKETKEVHVKLDINMLLDDLKMKREEIDRLVAEYNALIDKINNINSDLSLNLDLKEVSKITVIEE